jgi:hypothetical protein
LDLIDRIAEKGWEKKKRRLEEQFSENRGGWIQILVAGSQTKTNAVASSPKWELEPTSVFGFPSFPFTAKTTNPPSPQQQSSPPHILYHYISLSPLISAYYLAATDLLPTMTTWLSKQKKPDLQALAERAGVRYV